MERAGFFARFLIDTFGRAALTAGSGVVDVAGGRGMLSFELSAEAIPCCLVDERRHAEPDRKMRKRMRKQQGKLSGQQGQQGEPRGEAVAAHGGNEAGDEAAEDVAQVAVCFEATPTEAVAEAEVPAAVEAAETAEAAEAIAEDGSAGGAGSEAAPPFVHLRARFDADFQAAEHERLASASLLAGMHPDQATEPIVDAALRLKVPFAIVPCCVFAREFPRTGVDGFPVTTYAQLLDYLQAKAPGIQRTHLPFIGRNVVLWRGTAAAEDGAAPSGLCVECVP